MCGETGYYGNRGGVGQRQAAAEEFILDKQSCDSPLACRTTEPEPEPLEPDQNLLRWWSLSSELDLYPGRPR